MLAWRYIAPQLLLWTAHVARAAPDLGSAAGNDDDLYSFVTRPEIKAPRYNVTKYHPDEVTPGYWFIAPYAYILQEYFPANYVQPCQTGPAIYDGDGELIWTGACLVKNQNACDFRVFEANGSSYMSTILYSNRQFDPAGRAVVLNNALQIVNEYRVPVDVEPVNMHEFNVLNDGKTALLIVQKPEVRDVTGVKGADVKAGLVLNMAAAELDLATRELQFEWWTHWDVPHGYSNVPPNKHLRGPFPMSWDWLHLNAVNKNEEGDYLVTARYTDSIYKISGQSATLEWSLGGQGSNFILDGFNVSGPHDAHFIRSEGDKEIITFLDNGGDEQRHLANTSTAYTLELDKSRTPWVARVLQKVTRPDGGRSDRRGNFQTLPNGNAFVGWSENGYVSEHTPDGRVLMEAQFSSKRFVTYRAYKFNMTTRPAELPVMKGFAYGSGPADSMSVYYVSWNGATDVKEYKFYNAETKALLGTVARKGFETILSQSKAYAETVYVDVIMKDGLVGGTSEVVTMERPEGWREEGAGSDAVTGGEKESGKDEL